MSRSEGPAKKRRCQRDDCDRVVVGRIDKKFCSPTCKNTAKSRRRRKRLAGPVASTPAAGNAIGEILAHEGLMEDLYEGRLTPSEAGALLGIHHSTVSRAVEIWQTHATRTRAAKDWKMDAEVAWMLAGGYDEFAREAVAVSEPERLGRLLDELVERFMAFEAKFFRTKTGPYIRVTAHRRWIREVLRAIFTGEEIQILAPPRHGKSELLVHFCVWLICRNPNITIIWIAGALKPTAHNMVGSVKAALESEAIVRATLPPDQAYRPATRAGKEWQVSSFRVANQDRTVVKSPTMLALGRGSKILSLDVDIAVLDDVEDHDSTAQAHLRAATRRWRITQFETRNEEHTAVVWIGSRQHYDDIYGHNLADPTINHIVEAAHEPDCPIDPLDEAAHVECMLVPQLRSYRWLHRKQIKAESAGEGGLFEMVYLNRPRPEGELVFDEEAIASCYNRARGLGTAGLPSDIRIVSGLDPAAVKYQAAFCWAWSDETAKMYMVDLDNRIGAGIPSAAFIFKLWLDEHGVFHWVVEENGWQRGIAQDDRIRDWRQRTGVYLEGHQTQGNKNDPRYGVTAMARLFHDKIIDLPYGTAEAREKVELYKRQLLAFTDTGTGVASRGATDLPMASWFPIKVIRRWQKETEAMAEMNYTPMFDSFVGISDEGLGL